MPARASFLGSAVAPSKLRKLPGRYPALGGFGKLRGLGRLRGVAPMPRVLPSFLRGGDPIMPEQGSRAFLALERARRRAKGIEVDFSTAREKSPLFGLGKLGGGRRRKSARKRRRASGKVTCRRQVFTLSSGQRVRRTVCRDSLGRLAKSRTKRARKSSRRGKRR